MIIWEAFVTQMQRHFGQSCHCKDARASFKLPINACGLVWAEYLQILIHSDIKWTIIFYLEWQMFILILALFYGIFHSSETTQSFGILGILRISDGILQTCWIFTQPSVRATQFSEIKSGQFLSFVVLNYDLLVLSKSEYDLFLVKISNLDF